VASAVRARADGDETPLLPKHDRRISIALTSRENLPGAGLMQVNARRRRQPILGRISRQLAEANMRLNVGAVILILLGVIFLLINPDIAPAAELKVLLTKWWPLLLIVVGVAAIPRPRRAL
jgi:hypothetical protein